MGNYVSLIITILIIILSTCIYYIRKYFLIKKLSKKEIKFDEFDDIEESLKQEEHEKKQMLADFELLNKVTNEANKKARDIGTVDAYIEAKQEIEKAKKDIKNFRFLDSVEVEEEKIYEGPTVTAIKENGNSFDVELFKKWCKEIFKCIKLGTEEEIDAAKHFITEELYARLIHQIKHLEQDNLKFVTEGLAIMDCRLLEYGNWLKKEEIKVLVRAKMKEYIINKSTDEIIRGNNKKFYDKDIIMTFLKRDVEDEEGFLKNCPNCGAETTNITLGRCRYCNTLIFPIRYNWTLVKFETV